MDCVIACDLGTGGNKTALYRADGACLAECVIDYPTAYPAPGHHEQRPADWWDAVAGGIRRVLADAGPDAAARVRAIGVSGHSLGCTPLDAHGKPLLDAVPIWSDGRAVEEAREFFARRDFGGWYHLTGNGFPAPLYPVFKLMWLRRHRPEAWAATRVVLGSKDYVNYRLSGVLATDPSYASGSGAYDLRRGDYDDEVLAAAGVPRAWLPDIVPSTAILGEVLPDVAASLGLPDGVRVVAGGVDNSCMALGANTFEEGDAYCAMGSSSWLTVASARPLTHEGVMPFVFAHVVPGRFISATSIFSSGTSLKWMRDTMLGGGDFEAMMALAAQAPPGANGLVFVPTLGGGTAYEGGPEVRGALVGLDLQHQRADLARATLEGIALALGVALEELRGIATLRDEIAVVGGGARSAIWRQILADVFDCAMVKTAVDQQAASLGAAALALVGVGAWRDFAPVAARHRVEARETPRLDPALRARMLARYRQAARHQRAFAQPMPAPAIAQEIPA